VTNKILRIIVALPAILFVMMGLNWAINPADAAAQLAMPLLDGLARGSQIGDLGALFLSMGLMILLALVTARRSWFYAPALMLSLAALFRLLAWILHDASLAPQMVVVEVVVALLLLLSSRRLAEKE
jgi:hypothetical protein